MRTGAVDRRNIVDADVRSRRVGQRRARQCSDLSDGETAVSLEEYRIGHPADTAVNNLVKSAARIRTVFRRRSGIPARYRNSASVIGIA